MRTRALLPLALLLIGGACFGPSPDQIAALEEEGRAVASGRIDPHDLSGRELRRAFKGFLAHLASIRENQAQLEVAEKGIEQFSGTPYEADLRRNVASMRDAAMYADFRARIWPWGWWRLRRDQYVRLLEDAKPHFAGTRYADMIDKMIEHHRREIEKGNNSRVRGDG
jgi:hypothetical protein